jgi:hypothetical protein
MMRHAVDHRSPTSWGRVYPPTDTRSTAVEWDPYPFSEEWRSKEFTFPAVFVIVGNDVHAISQEEPTLTFHELVEALQSRFSAPDAHLSTTKLRSDLVPEHWRGHGGLERLFRQTVSTTRIDQGYFDRALSDFFRSVFALSGQLGKKRFSYGERTPVKPKAKGLHLLDRIRAATASVPKEEWERLPKDLSVKFEEYLYGRPNLR